MIDAALIKGIVGGGGAGATALLVGALSLFPSKDVYQAHEAEFRAYTAAEQASDLRQQIADTVERAAAEEPGEYKASLCKSLVQAIGELCEIASQDALCQDRAIFIRKAGCD